MHKQIEHTEIQDCSEVTTQNKKTVFFNQAETENDD